MGTGIFFMIIFWTELLSCQSNPAKRSKLSNELDHQEAVKLLFRFTREAVKIDQNEKNNSETNHSFVNMLFPKKPPPTDPPMKIHSAAVESKGTIKSPNDPSKSDADESGDGSKEQGPKFDDKAIQRAFLVFGGLCALLLIYFGLKFIFIKKRKAVGRYGRVDSSEMDLLESNDDVEEEEDDTLFDIHAHRRT